MADSTALHNPTPKHIGIIMDGNGRWAKQRKQQRLFGHRKGVEKVSDIIQVAIDIDVKFLTLYSFSTENWRRSEDEVSGLFKLIEQFIKDKGKEFLQENIRFTCIGDLSALPDKTQKALNQLVEQTCDNTRITICAALNYGGRADIMQAAQKFAKMVADKEIAADALDEPLFDSLLNTSDMPAPELIIRTGGEKRVSNFLIWQSAYSEFYFTDSLWPDFSKDEFLAAIEFYQTRNRRFGNSEAQMPAEHHAQSTATQRQEIINQKQGAFEEILKP